MFFTSKTLPQNSSPAKHREAADTSGRLNTYGRLVHHLLGMAIKLSTGDNGINYFTGYD
ncbi:hypothetical protein [Methylomonas albis]|nr:hypothetical protein [Methylomonas albis]